MSTSTGPGTSPKNNNSSTTAATSAVSSQHSRHLQKSRTLVNLYEELLELRGPVPTVYGADHLAGGGVERREQRGDAVAYVVVGTFLRHARHHRQHRRRAVQRLDLAFLVGAQ